MRAAGLRRACQPQARGRHAHARGLEKRQDFRPRLLRRRWHRAPLARPPVCGRGGRGGAAGAGRLACTGCCPACRAKAPGASAAQPRQGKAHAGQKCCASKNAAFQKPCLVARQAIYTFAEAFAKFSAINMQGARAIIKFKMSNGPAATGESKVFCIWPGGLQALSARVLPGLRGVQPQGK